MLNNEAVAEYAELLVAECKLPPLEVVDVEGDLVLLDGFHRLAAARQADHEFIRVEVLEHCDIGRALWLAASKNQGHGVRRSSADKRQCVLLALESDVGQEQASRTIAEHVGVSHTLVNNIRAELESGNGCHSEAPGESEREDVLRDREERAEEDMYHTASRRIRGCYKKVCAILGEDDDVCEALYVALEKAREREL